MFLKSIDKKPNHEDKDDIEEVYDSGDYFKPYNDDCNSCLKFYCSRYAY
jgi:hypothetical protein